MARHRKGRGGTRPVRLPRQQDDLAEHTSSSSTKLIHGGLRYLEHGELRPCANRSRNATSLASAPQSSAAAFVLTVCRRARRGDAAVGVLYDTSGAARSSRIRQSLRAPARHWVSRCSQLVNGFESADCWVEAAVVVSTCATLSTGARTAASHAARLCSRARWRVGAAVPRPHLGPHAALRAGM